jgi:phospholipase C
MREERREIHARYDVHQVERRQCNVFGPGSMTTESIGPDVPHGAALPFQHVVVLVQENHSFDNYLSDLPGAGMPDVDVASPHASNPSGDGGVVTRRHMDRPCETSDLDHEWEASHIQYDDGRMDGFVRTNRGSAAPMTYYEQRDLPYYYWLATTFGIGDRHFSSLLGPTWPNRFFALAATAAGVPRVPGRRDGHPRLRRWLGPEIPVVRPRGLLRGGGRPRCRAGGLRLLEPARGASAWVFVRVDVSQQDPACRPYGLDVAR